MLHLTPIFIQALCRRWVPHNIHVYLAAAAADAAAAAAVSLHHLPGLAKRTGFSSRQPLLPANVTITSNLSIALPPVKSALRA